MSLEFDLSNQHDIYESGGRFVGVFKRSISFSHPFNDDNNVSEGLLNMQVSYSSYNFVSMSCLNMSDA
jgi:hypothetical protein